MGSLEKNTDEAKTSTPHALNKRILLWGIDSSRPVPDLFCRKKVPKVVGHKLAPLVGTNNVRSKLVSKAHIHAEVSKE